MTSSPSEEATARKNIDARLAAYVAAAGAVTTVLASEAQAVVVANNTLQTIGINGTANIDFNSDGLIDFQLDHDRYPLNSTNIDYLQIDKNDVNGELNPLPIDGNQQFPAPMGVTPNGALSYDYLQSQTAAFSSFYPAALNDGDVIGVTPPSTRSWGFQESDNAFSSGGYRRHNRLIDEDVGQIDASLGKSISPPTDVSEWVGLNGEPRFLGLRVNLNGLGGPNNELFHYGWAKVRITNEADATAELLGYAYENEVGQPIMAGDAGPTGPAGDYDGDNDVDGEDFLVWQRQFGATGVQAGSGADGDGDQAVTGSDLTVWARDFGQAGQIGAVPEPGSALLAGLGGLLLLAVVAIKRSTALARRLGVGARA